MYSTCKLVKLLQLYNSTICASKQELELTDALDSNYQLQMHPNNSIGIEEYFHFHPALALLAQCNSSAPIPTSKRSLSFLWLGNDILVLYDIILTSKPFKIDSHGALVSTTFIFRHVLNSNHS